MGQVMGDMCPILWQAVWKARIVAEGEVRWRADGVIAGAADAIRVQRESPLKMSLGDGWVDDGDESAIVHVCLEGDVVDPVVSCSAASVKVSGRMANESPSAVVERDVRYQ